MGSPVYIYNSTATDLDISVNRGPPVRVPAAAPPAYAPGTPSGGGPQLDAAPYAQPGVFCLGRNEVLVTSPSGGGESFSIDLGSAGGRRIGSAQLYLFGTGAGAERPSWTFLADGQLVAASG